MTDTKGTLPHSARPTPPEKRGVSWAVLRATTRHQWLYLPRLFSRRERIQFMVLALLALIGVITLAARITLRFTVPAPDVGGILREGATQEPRFINPLYASTDTDRALTKLVFGALIRYDHTGMPVMDLAEKIDVSSGGKEYTVTLRPNIQWHDGEPFSADDVVFTIRTIQDPEYKSPLRSNWQGVTVERVNDRTVRFVLRQSYAPFLENLALGMLPEHLWKKIPRASATLSDLNVKPVGTGAYQFEKFAHRDDGTITSITLARNAHSYRDGPYLKEIQFSFYPDEEKLAAAYRRNEIDSFVILSRKTKDAIAGLDLAIHPLKLPKLFAVFLNANSQPALGRKAVRQALAMAIDRDALIRKTLGSDGIIVNSALPPGTLGFNSDIAAIPYDVDGARNRLTADGWKDVNHNGTFERTEGSGKKKTTQKLEVRLVTSDAPDLATAANLIADMWRAIGVKVDVGTLALNDLETNVIRPRNYNALLFGEVFGHDPDPFAFWHTSQLKDPGLNIALYSNRKVDQLLEEARRTNDTALRESKYRDFQKIVADDSGAIFLYSPTHYYAARTTIRGVNIGSIALTDERFNEVSTWYVNTRRVLK